MGVDVFGIGEHHRHAEAADGALPPALAGHDSQARELVFDLESARRLLAAAGVRSAAAGDAPFGDNPDAMSRPILERLNAELTKIIETSEPVAKIETWAFPAAGEIS